tara:strand:+ start:148239 stop:149303 length:1065 start_codon:yes stop_codon:yes gene_type:complete
MKHLIFLSFLIITNASASFGDYSPRKDWNIHKVCENQKCLEIVEIQNHKPGAKKILLMPGLFQNAYIFDLLPTKGISLARYMIEKWNLHPFILHTRGVGSSDYIPNSNMDSIAMEDIPKAINYLYRLNGNKKILIGGHSQGAITLQASLAGLSQCLVVPCFNPIVANSRQRKIEKVALLAGNTAMSFEYKSILEPISQAALKAHLLFRPLDEIDLNTFTKITMLVTRVPFWEFLYNRENVSQEARDALYKYSVDTSTKGILLQFAKGVINKDIRTEKSGFSWPKNNRFIRVPLFQQTYGDDKLADPISTKRDSFAHIGSREKEYETIWDRGHEDFFMNQDLHRDLDSVFSFLTK